MRADRAILNTTKKCVRI
jgi:hypothetical protein